jgi:broad specificity phosphatase PhoE
LHNARAENEKRTQSGRTVIYFVRHADVQNPGDILYGRLPRFGLSDLGRQQARVTAAVLSAEPVRAIYSSPQLRARQTASVVRAAHPKVPLHISQLLAEVVTGWQGRRHSELAQIGFNFYDNRLLPTDESLDDLWARAGRFVARVRQRHAGESMVAVTHGDLCHLVRAGFRGLPIEIASIRLPHPYPGHGSLTRLTFGDDAKETYPISVEYYDPNGQDPTWSRGWVRLEMVGEVASA